MTCSSRHQTNVENVHGAHSLVEDWVNYISDLQNEQDDFVPYAHKNCGDETSAGTDGSLGHSCQPTAWTHLYTQKNQTLHSDLLCLNTLKELRHGHVTDALHSTKHFLNFPLGYVEVAVIPVGARNIQVMETKPCTSFLGKWTENYYTS